ncbi:DNA-processing protein DprA [Paenibacillus sp. PAMC21692]|uniref:DNA-processing protein DprA n=1 Tax=Paenibacillus sp. PAMC21692 TaxID=2762320 RepID=UPI00164DA207|nr:DNA-processing protein DprA [Paenibacillus sp. PAMC21692]QNK54746.1 DNA-protecting protein DprA [Paenibacillus sp. PAMC21692]
MDDNKRAIRDMVVALNEIPGIGWHAIKNAIEHKLWTKDRTQPEAWMAAGFRDDRAEKAANLFRQPIWNSGDDKGWMKAESVQAGVGMDRLLTPFDAGYPFELKHIAQPPWVLYAKGRSELLERPSVAIVGTRMPTAYGRHTADKLAQELSEAGITVVSGLARGIDSRAHEAALKGNGSTIAVLPTPIDTCYPPQNLSLFRNIGEQGLLVSETPLGTKLHPGQFHQRNRIIAGLACATIVVEGARRSGSLITAKFALDWNREIFAVPGPINSPKSEGPNVLIREERARIITGIDDIFDQLLWLRDAAKPWGKQGGQTVGSKEKEERPQLPEEAKLLALLRDRPLSIDELHGLTAIPFGHLNSLLLNLCIKRTIELQPGSIYRIL